MSPHEMRVATALLLAGVSGLLAYNGSKEKRTGPALATFALSVVLVGYAWWITFMSGVTP